MDSLTSTTGSISTTLPPSPLHDALKSVLIISLFISSFLASILPFALRQWASHGSSGHIRVRVFSLLSVLGGGVFLGTCLLDLLPDALESIRLAQVHGAYQLKLPLTELLVAGGFFFVLAVEQVTLFLKEQNYIGSDVSERLIANEEVFHDPSHPQSHNDEFGEVDLHFDPTSHSTMRCALLVMALSLHAVFEGLSLGVTTDVNVLLQVFFALLLHKTIISFSLGLRLVQCKMKVFTIVVCCLVFTSQVIIGGFGGIAILELISAGSASTSAMLCGCAQAFACGTFLYITCFEILPHELSQSGFRVLKLLFLAIGFSIITVMIAVFPDQN